MKSFKANIYFKQKIKRHNPEMELLNQQMTVLLEEYAAQIT